MSEQQINQSIEKKIVKKLSTWFSSHARNLPWRVTYSPYQVLISEVMLQQTQIKTALLYYQNWLIEFPDIQTLADAPIEKVMNHWQGLGYYSRARNLHKLAKIVCNDYQSKLPKCYDDLIKLPGIGPYSAGAISSIAFNQKIPAIDGNVRRVFARLFAFNGAINQTKNNFFFQTKATELLEFAKPRIFNQALMELGALICLPKKPNCKICPVQKQCKSYQTNKVNDYPIVQKRKIHQTSLLFFLTSSKDNKIALIFIEAEEKYKENKNKKQKKLNWWQGLYSLPYLRFSGFKSFGDMIKKTKILHSQQKQLTQLIHQNQFAISNHKVRFCLLLVSEDFLLANLDDSIKPKFFSFNEILNLPLSSQTKKLLKIAKKIPTGLLN